MSADMLRRAATLLRERASAASPRPWVASSSGHLFGCIPGDELGRLGAPSDASYIAAVDPGVGLALADWLDAAAPMMYVTHDRCDSTCGMAAAIAVARAVLGEPA